MEMSDRKRRILQAVIDEYMGTAEPVGSRSISKKNDLGLSSATIRNEMADLEDMGYLIQPHTSAGRIPSDAAYRVYVNTMLTKYQVSVETLEKLQHELEERVNKLDVIIRKASVIASALTDYATVITTPELNEAVIKRFELVDLGTGNVILIIVTNTGSVRNRIMNFGELKESDIRGLSDVLNRSLTGLTAHDITFEKIQDIHEQIKGMLSIPPKILINIMNFVYSAIEDMDETEIIVENAKSILSYPEYNSVQEAKKMFTFLEDKKNLKGIVSGGDKKVNVKIGSENECEELSNSSIVTVNYSIKDKAIGKIGVIGPKRMDYAKVIANLNCISEYLDKILYQFYINESEG